MKGDALALVKALRGFGVPESVLEPSVILATLGRKRYRIARLSCTSSGNVLPNKRTAVSNAQEALDRSKEKLTGLEDEVATLELRCRELSVDPLTPSSSKVASEVG